MRKKSMKSRGKKDENCIEQQGSEFRVKYNVKGNQVKL